MKTPQEIIERWRELVEEQTSPLHEASLLMVFDEIKQSLLQAQIAEIRKYNASKYDGNEEYEHGRDDALFILEQQLKELSK